MVTQFGKMLRNIRMDRGELLKDMAKKLEVTSSYLSAVESGKRSIPEAWLSTLSVIYELNHEMTEALVRAAEESAKQVKINLDDAPPSSRNLAFAFAREFRSLSDTDCQTIMSVLNQKGDGSH